MKVSSTCTSVLALVLAAGCTVGDISGPLTEPGAGADAGPDDVAPKDQADATPGAPDAAPPDYALAVAPVSGTLSLGQELVFTINLSSARFDGPVTLSAAGVPDSWLVSFTPSETLDLDYDGSSVATMTVQVPTDAEAADVSITVNALAEPGERSTQAAVSVANELVLQIAPGVGDGQHGFPGLATVRLGATIKITNTDGTAHRIHSGSGDEGFPHQSDPMAQGESHEFTITAPGQYDYYCHVHNVAAGVGAFRVLAPAP